MQYGATVVGQQKAGACLSFYKELGNTAYSGGAAWGYLLRLSSPDVQTVS